MKLIRVGNKVLNLRYLILAEEGMGGPDDPPPGSVRVTVETGRVLTFEGPQADEFRKGLDEHMRPEPPATTGITTPRASASVEPGADPLPAPGRKRKSKG
jgi:hypothetical protein